MLYFIHIHRKHYMRAEHFNIFHVNLDYLVDPWFSPFVPNLFMFSGQTRTFHIIFMHCTHIVRGVLCDGLYCDAGWLVVGSHSWPVAKRCTVGLQLLPNTNRKLYSRNSMVPLSTTWCDRWSGIWAQLLEFWRIFTYYYDFRVLSVMQPSGVVYRVRLSQADAAVCLLRRVRHILSHHYDLLFTGCQCQMSMSNVDLYSAITQSP